MTRIVGVDVARGLAVLGMMTAHVGPEPPDPGLPHGLRALADGRPSALFVVLAGLSLALLSGGSQPATGRLMLRARVRIAVRGVLVLILGVWLAALGTPVVVILPTYAVLFLVGILVLSWPTSALVFGAAALAVLTPPLRAAVTGGDPSSVEGQWLAELLVGPYYPALVWAAYLLAGLALGRCDLRSARIRWRVCWLGAVLAVVGYGGAWAAQRVGAVADALGGLASSEPHSSTTFEVAGNTGVALVVIAACLAAADAWPRAVAPVAAVGALALTAYTVHLVVIWQLGPGVVYDASAGGWLAFLLVTIAACWAWRTWLGRGPLERVLHGVSTTIADRAVRVPVAG